MKKMFLVSMMVLSLMFAGSGVVMANGYGPGGYGPSGVHFEGVSEQQTGVFLVDGNYTLNNDNTVTLNNGAMGYANEDSSAEFSGKNGIGLGAAIGGSSLWSSNNTNTAWVAGLTGSASLAAVTGSKIDASIDGNGEMGTAAFKQKGINTAVASTYGSYEYNGSINHSGIIAGGGVTGGGSYVNNSVSNGITNVSAVSGQTTIVGGSSF